MIWMLVLLLCSAHNRASPFTTFQERPVLHQCLSLQVPSCQNLGYNETSFPNFLGTRSHAEAEESMISYNPWLQYGCSSELRLFLCGIYAPMCSPAGLIVPCQSFCKFMRAQCSPILMTFGYSWPADLDCSRLPASNTPGNLCMESPVHSRESQTEFPQRKNRGSCEGAADCPCGNNAIRTASFSPQDKEFASVWMAIWSVVCFGVTVFTLVSYILSRTRYGFLESGAFRYPHRCCLHMVVCYCMVSAGYLMRLGLGPSFTTCAAMDKEQGSSPLSYENREVAVLDTSCVLVFLLLYYFTNAAAMWFSVLCGCWLGGVWRNWGHALLLRGAVYMHLVAWGAPAVLSILVLSRRVLMPDQLSGTCYPGHGSSVALVRWVLLPLLLPFLLGTAMLMLAFARLWRVQLAINKRRPEYFPDASAAGYIGPAPCCIIGAERSRINGANPGCAAARSGHGAVFRPRRCNAAGPSLKHAAGPSVSNTAGPGVSDTAGPSLGHSAYPGLSNTAGPSISNTAGPSHSTTSGSSLSNAADPGLSNTADPSISNTAGPSVSVTAGPSTSNTASLSLSTTAGPGHRCANIPRPSSSIDASYSSTIGPCDSFGQSKLEAGSSSCCPRREGNIGQCTSKCLLHCADCEASLCHPAEALAHFQTNYELQCNSNEPHSTKSHDRCKKWNSQDDPVGKRGTNSSESTYSKTFPIPTSSQSIDISSENRSVRVTEVKMHSSNQLSSISSEEQRHWERLSGSYPEVHPKSNKTAAKCQHEDRQIENPDGPCLTFHSKASKKSNKYAEADQRKPMVALPPDISRRPAQKAARIGVIAVLYMLPTACLVGAVFQESTQRDRWQQDPTKLPSIEVFMLKIFTSLAPGIVLSLFLGNNRVMHSWRQLGERLYAIHSGAQDCPSLQRSDDEKSYCRAYGPDTAFSGHQCIQKLQSQVHGMDEISRRRSCRHHDCYSGHVPSDEAQKPPQCREKLRGGETAKPILKRSGLSKAEPSVRPKNGAFPLTTEDGSVVSDRELHAPANATASDPSPRRQEYIALDTTPPDGQHENQAPATTSGVMHEKTTDGVVVGASDIISNNFLSGSCVHDAWKVPRTAAENRLLTRNPDFAREEVISANSSSDRIPRGNLELCQNAVILGEVSTYQNERPSHALSRTNGRKEQCSLRPERETLPFVDLERRALSPPNSKGKKQDEGLSKKTLKNKRQKDRETSL